LVDFGAAERGEVFDIEQCKDVLMVFDWGNVSKSHVNLGSTNVLQVGRSVAVEICSTVPCTIYPFDFVAPPNDHSRPNMHV
jgi:hypothetical protein